MHNRVYSQFLRIVYAKSNILCLTCRCYTTGRVPTIRETIVLRIVKPERFNYDRSGRSDPFLPGSAPAARSAPSDSPDTKATRHVVGYIYYIIPYIIYILFFFCWYICQVFPFQFLIARRLVWIVRCDHHVRLVLVSVVIFEQKYRRHRIDFSVSHSLSQ